ncbi:hypothetical protein GW916_07540 [bacterium]|nr:hypothetical protein [bacterium]
MIQLKALFLMASLLFASSSMAKIFDVEYLSFELSDDWSCEAVPPNWICEPNKASDKKFALITLTAKEAGAIDQIQNFEAELAKPRSHQMGSDTPIMSQVLKNSRANLNGFEWVQSLHIGSEIHKFKTMYLATVKKPLAIMLTLSAEEQHWDKFSPVFNQVVKSLQLKTISPKSRIGQSGSGGSGNLVGTQSNPQQALSDYGDAPPPKSQKLPTVYILGLVLAGLVLAAAFYLFTKK